jgi:hypothetical protein
MLIKSESMNAEENQTAALKGLQEKCANLQKGLFQFNIDQKLR